jgi:hypothetical protein
MDQAGVGEANGSASTERVTATWAIDAGQAHLAVWSFLAPINQVLISICLPKPWIATFRPPASSSSLRCVARTSQCVARASA